ncbi:hypothetical protein CCUS01_06562 [Colletotrichum cuscutae]|uniref:Uncharacterized protein n=1 Tax=Colletotrichum cuscutae TaxID=1209917 RepID=A0AAI9XZS9_9PEZI|nr:hypothetical protein CCUS01_06562 [Colletotrichum cuscutae]
MVPDTFVLWHYYRTLLGVQSSPDQDPQERLDALQSAARQVFDPHFGLQTPPQDSVAEARLKFSIAFIHAQYQRFASGLPHLYLLGQQDSGEDSLLNETLCPGTWEDWDIRPPSFSGDDKDWELHAAEALAILSSKFGAFVPETVSGSFSRADLLRWKKLLLQHTSPRKHQPFDSNEIQERLKTLKRKHSSRPQCVSFLPSPRTDTNHSKRRLPFVAFLESLRIPAPPA